MPVVTLPKNGDSASLSFPERSCRVAVTFTGVTAAELKERIVTGRREVAGPKPLCGWSKDLGFRWLTT
jgi:hypothetical protein